LDARSSGDDPRTQGVAATVGRRLGSICQRRARITGFFTALRGEEIVRTDVGAFRKYWNEAMGWKDDPHVPLMLAGRFKREMGEKWFCQPLATVTKSGVDIRLWLFRGMSELEKFGIKTGPMFRAGLGSKRASTSDLNIRLHSILKRVQQRWPNLIPDDVEVTDQFSVYRSLRRGATAEAQNARIPQEVIEVNNRWRKHAQSRGLTPGMAMMERCTDAKASVPSLIRFSGGMLRKDARRGSPAKRVKKMETAMLAATVPPLNSPR
jgi:hypothetical protein